MKHLRPHLLVGLLLSLLVLSGLHPWLREALLDARFGLLTRQATGDIVLVEIDPRSIEALGRWPWPRSVHAELVQRLERAGATDIVFDVDFSTPSTPDQDAAFAAALQAVGGSVILPAFRQRVADRGDGHTLHINRPIPLFAQQAWLALVNVLPEPDGIIRRYSHGAVIEGEFIPSVGALLAGRHDQNAPPFRIDFGIQPTSVPSLSAIDILRETPAALAALRGKKAIIAGTAAELGDRFTVPNGRIIPGSLVQALAAESIIQGRTLTTTSPAVSLSGLAALIIAMAAIWGWTGAGRRILVLALLALAIEGTAICVQAFHPIAFDSSLLLAAIAAYALTTAIDEIDLRGLLRLTAERRFERIAMSLSDGLVCVDQAGRITLWNPGASAIFGHPEQAAIGQPFEFLLAQGDGGVSEAPFRLTAVPLARLLQRGGTVVELVGLRRSGEHFDLECSLSCWDTATGVQYGVVLRDISLRKRQQEHIRYLAECDTVTGLPNRNSLMAHLEDAISRSEPDTATLLLVGVNRFQQINNLYGHSFGDALVVALVERLRVVAAQASLIARLGSDEFAILFAGEAGEATALGERIVADFQYRPVTVGDRPHRITVAIGLASTSTAQHAEMLIGNAHFALASAKAQPSAAPVPFDPLMRGAIEQREALEAELRTALADNEFELFYQPQIELRTGAIVGAEALIRWRHRERGYVSPAEFMPVVNTTSLSEDVAAWVLETACRRAADWQRRGYAIRIGVNLAQSQFATGDLAAEVERRLTENGLRPELLELEVTEDIILDDGAKTLRVLAALRALGVKIAFDDFGTGYGSLTYLKTFPLDKIKIDQSFVKRLEPGSQDAAIVAATIDLGQALGLSVIAEGIETPATAGLLREMGCGEGQGYLISKPIPAKEFEAKFLSKETRLVA
ncbi:diguanylate cyclase/phosphodiesterase with PAS/PAC and Chase sensor(s) [Bosea sp. OK403]|uniref:EAL domain-containing protein n=1 Tax=Bosea sp. OK403 TaxID=1855286 RepID=UPI0008EBA014|nr:EAL domain-containing protein [Bosea sp. OK403]SFJ80614.1 diguanylate cyclase/phosphodiesterase with PAS/PAC and Chase sensor(s) [Bosea sp. OK403]